jgi:hypothetical protein
LKITCIEEDVHILSKITSLRLNHIATTWRLYPLENMLALFIHIVNPRSEHVPNIIGRWQPSY